MMCVFDIHLGVENATLYMTPLQTSSVSLPLFHLLQLIIEVVTLLFELH